MSSTQPEPAPPPASSPLDRPEALPLRAPSALADFGPTLVVAPHPDDESLGCGGLVALLRQRSTPVRVVFVSDGTGSHPNSRAYPPERLRALREAEALRALGHLGMAPDAATFLRLPDRAVPCPGQDGFAPAAERCQRLLQSRAARPQTVVLPWRRDPHGDHRAAWHLFRHAARPLRQSIRFIEYPLWVWTLGAPADWPRRGEVKGWRLDVASVRPAKQAAIAAHRSQLTNLIQDDPEGFRLEPHMLRPLDRPWEVYLEDFPP